MPLYQSLRYRLAACGLELAVTRASESSAKLRNGVLVIHVRIEGGQDPEVEFLSAIKFRIVERVQGTVGLEYTSSSSEAAAGLADMRIKPAQLLVDGIRLMCARLIGVESVLV